ncbi:MAG: hypothetical protein ACKERF_01570 [Candidatus Hodgkinia cicadicola]
MRDKIEWVNCYIFLSLRIVKSQLCHNNRRLVGPSCAKVLSAIVWM